MTNGDSNYIGDFYHGYSREVLHLLRNSPLEEVLETRKREMSDAKNFYFARARRVALQSPFEWFKGRKTERNCNGWMGRRAELVKKAQLFSLCDNSCSTVVNTGGRCCKFLVAVRDWFERVPQESSCELDGLAFTRNWEFNKISGVSRYVFLCALDNWRCLKEDLP